MVVKSTGSGVGGQDRETSRPGEIVVFWIRRDSACAEERYERQGLLVEEEALARAEQECLIHVEARQLARSAPPNGARNSIPST